MKTVGNFLFALFVGFILSIYFFLHACFLCVTILYFPVGVAYLKNLKFLFAPFGYDFYDAPISEYKRFINILYAIFIGLPTAIGLVITGVFLCLTIIFIPFALQVFKFSKFACLPVNKVIRPII